jgi:hypothetical protein
MPPTLSTPVAVVMILSLLLGGLTQVIQTGALFGSIVTPKAWLPALTIAATFLGGVVSYFGGLSPVVLTGSSVFYAVVAGVSALLSSTVPALAIHAHVTVPQQVRAWRAAKAADFHTKLTPPGGVQT